MASSVINGAIGKSPLIDKVNQMAAKEVMVRANAQMEQDICGGKIPKYPSVPVSFPECKKEIRNQLAGIREERQDKK